MKILLKNARILSMKEGEEIYSSSLVIKDGIIIYIGENYQNYEPFDHVIDIKENLIMPSFKNLHGHAPMVFLRGLTDGVDLETWLNEIVFPLEKHLTSEMIYSFTKLALLEYLASGITHSSEMYFYPTQIIKAALEYHYPIEVVICRKDYQGIIEEIKKMNEDHDFISYTVGLHSVYTVDEEEILSCHHYLMKNKEGLCVHACETKREVEECKELHHGLTPIEYLDHYGLFKYGGRVYHANHLTPYDIRIIKENNVIPITCVGSNTKLASGICPIRELLDQDIPVAIGTDGPASNDSLDMFYEIRLILALQKISHSDPSIIKPREVLKMATVNGALALNDNESCYLTVGQKANLIEIDLSRPQMQPINDVVNNLVFSGSKDLIKMTIVNGNVLYRDGQFFVQDDIDALYKECQNYADELKKYLVK